MGFIGGHDARVWENRSAADRRTAALQNLANYFGTEALNPREVVEFNWSTEVWNRGCPVAVLAPGTLIDFGTALRTPVGPHPLGRHRDLHVLERLHGRRGALGRARRTGSARGP